MLKIERCWVVLAVLVAVAVALPGVVFAVAPDGGAGNGTQPGTSKERLQEFRGVVSVNKEMLDDGTVKIKAITVTVPAPADKNTDKATVYNVVLDEKGMALIALNGKTVTGAGVVAVNNTGTWLTVKFAKEAKPRPRPTE